MTIIQYLILSFTTSISLFIPTKFEFFFDNTIKFGCEIFQNLVQIIFHRNIINYICWLFATQLLLLLSFGWSMFTLISENELKTIRPTTFVLSPLYFFAQKIEKKKKLYFISVCLSIEFLNELFKSILPYDEPRCCALNSFWTSFSFSCVCLLLLLSGREQVFCCTFLCFLVRSLMGWHDFCI